MIEATQLYCPDSGGKPGEDNTTHHIYTTATGSTFCKYCRKTPTELCKEGRTEEPSGGYVIRFWSTPGVIQERGPYGTRQEALDALNEMRERVGPHAGAAIFRESGEAVES